jgi:hypothetical protein
MVRESNSKQQKYMELQPLNTEASQQEQTPSLKWWNLLVSLTTISRSTILEINFAAMST